VTHITDSQFLTHLDELDSSEWLCQYVCELSVSTNVLHFYNAISNTLSYEMIPSINVFASFMVHWIFTQLNG
jgi:hypothetical protein